MNAYRQQQRAAAALIESGNYTAEQVAEIFGWINPKRKPPERAAPERSGTDRQQTGDKNALTPRRKCGIIKSIWRKLRRMKQNVNVEEKKMKKYAVYTHYDSNKSVIGYIIPQFDNGIAFITQRTYNALMRKRTVGGNAGIYSDYPGEIRITNNDKTEFIGYMQ